MTEPTVDAVLRVDAGIVWESLNKNGPGTIGDIAKTTGLRRESLWCTGLVGSREQDCCGTAGKGNGLLCDSVITICRSPTRNERFIDHIEHLDHSLSIMVF